MRRWRLVASTSIGDARQHSMPSSSGRLPVSTSRIRARRPVPTLLSTPKRNSTISMKSHCSCETSITQSAASLRPTGTQRTLPRTPCKDMLRRKNRLMRAGRVEEAGALSVRIGQAIQNCCRAQMSRYNGKTDAGGMWAVVRARRLTGRQQPAARVDGITAMSQRIRTTSHRTGKRHPKRLMCHHSASVSGRRSER